MAVRELRDMLRHQGPKNGNGRSPTLKRAYEDLHECSSDSRGSRSAGVSFGFLQERKTRLRRIGGDAAVGSGTLS